MLFNSLQFLIFFPIVTLIYFVIPHKLRYLWLLMASYYFYMCWNPKYALLMATSTLLTYFSGVLIDRSNKVTDDQKREFQKKLWVALSFLSNLSILFFFKYFDFAFVNLTRVFALAGIQLVQPAFDVVLPVGISFYTFQALSYTMDVYRGDIPAQRNVARYALFVSFFPQLVAGPIERSKNLLTQIDERHYFDYDRVKNGLLLMLWGFFQKLVIADRVALLVNQVYNNYTQYAGFQIVIATVFFAIQIYCDFSSYSDIAIGAAQVMGFRLMQNFRQPYFADSVADFWRRWHISLSTWFKDYLYIPLGGSRKGKWRTYFNIMLVFLASGLWHGASWSFVVWGGLNGIYQIIGKELKPLRDWVVQKFGINRKAFSHRLLKIGTTFALINFSWVFFRAAGARQALSILKQMLSNFNLWIFFDGSLYTMGLDQKDFTLAIVAMVVLFAVSFLHSRGISLRQKIARQGLWFRWGIYYAAIFSVLILGIYGSGYDASQFIYFQF